MKSDIEIAREAKLRPIAEVAEDAGVKEEALEQYGRYIAKLPLSLIDDKKIEKSKLILVTAITPTKAGIGKTTVSVECGCGNEPHRQAGYSGFARTSAGPLFRYEAAVLPAVAMPRCCLWIKSTFTLQAIFMPSLRRIT